MVLEMHIASGRQGPIWSTLATLQRLRTLLSVGAAAGARQRH